MSDFTPKPGFKFDPVPPKEALEYFRAKGWKVGFDHRDVWRQEHAYAFTVAKAMELDVLQTIRGEVDKALAEGRTLRQFQRDLEPMLQRQGWWGVKELRDPVTGELRPVQLGSPRRLRTIYRANLRTARAAGQWERAQRNLRTHPYLVYRLGPSREHREQHVAWDGLVLPADDPWWNTHMPPNGWGCKCRVRQVSRREAARLGGPVEAPKVTTREWRNRRTGRVERVPVGIDPGWDTNPGVARLRPFTPPEQDEPPPVSFPPGTAPPAMPAPRQVSQDQVLPEGLPPQEYAAAFLKEFGADLGKEAVHVDQVGQAVAISEALFRDSLGRWKAGRRRRGTMMRLLARTVREPDEIWWLWDRDQQGNWQLYRHYIARWEVGDDKRQAFAIFRWGNEGWSGVTTFDPDKEPYLERRRGGILAYRREK